MGSGAPGWSVSAASAAMWSVMLVGLARAAQQVRAHLAVAQLAQVVQRAVLQRAPRRLRAAGTGAVSGHVPPSAGLCAQ